MKPGDRFKLPFGGVGTVIQVQLEGDMWTMDYSSPVLHERNPIGTMYFHPDSEFEMVTQ